MTESFKTIYKNNVVVEILMITPQKGHIRKVRSLKAEDDKVSLFLKMGDIHVCIHLI